MAAQEDKNLPGIVSAAKEREEFQSTIEEKQEQIRALATEEYKKSFASSNENTTTRLLGFGPSGCDRKVEGQNIVEGILLTEKCDVNGDDGIKKMYFFEHEMRRSAMHEHQVLYGQASAERGAFKEKTIVKAHVAIEDSVSDNLLEVKKKMLLEELEAVVLPEGEFASEKVAGCKLVHQDFPIPRSLGIEVIDDTALIETIPASAIGKKVDVVGYRKCTGQDAMKEIDVKNEKRSRRKAKGGNNGWGMDGKNKSVTRVDEARNLSGDRNDGAKRKYSRKEIEVMRFLNMAEQRKVWKAVYSGLNAAVAKEYDNLASSEHQKHIRLNYDPQQFFAKKKEAPAILSAVSVCCENMDSKLQQMDSNENMNPIDPSCSPSLDEDGCTFLGECSEDGDSEDDYDSIQKPAFLVDGVPNFDSGPPEDGWEYLRRVRWEAAQIPKVKVAKLDRSKLNKEQSDYMPMIPDIAKCPEHLLPLKRWENAFLAEFSELRANLSQLEGLSVKRSRYLQPVTPHLEEDLLLNHKSLEEPIDQPILTADNKDTSSSFPLLSKILRMDSVARVSMLQKRIHLLDPVETISRNDCMWLFALCAMVDSLLDADTCSSLRSLLRKCAKLRATKTEFDDQVVMLNILAAISGRYFGQAEN